MKGMNTAGFAQEAVALTDLLSSSKRVISGLALAGRSSPFRPRWEVDRAPWMDSSVGGLTRLE